VGFLFNGRYPFTAEGISSGFPDGVIVHIKAQHFVDNLPEDVVRGQIGTEWVP
jgi:hypothetical protein